MSEVKNPAKLTSIQNGYALGQDDLYRNKPFHGTIFRAMGGEKVYLDYISQEERLTLSQFLNTKNINEGSFILDTKNESGDPVTIEFHIDKSGEGKKSLNPFLSNHTRENNNSERSGMSASLREEYELQNTRLSNNLQESDRKNRELAEELLQVKRELSKDTTATMLAHKDEIRKLEKEHDAQVRKLEKEVSELKTELKFKELEYIRSDRDGISRVFDFLEENGESIFAGILSQLQQGGQNPNITPQQLQQAWMNEAGELVAGPRPNGQPAKEGQPPEEPPAEETNQQKLTIQKPSDEDIMAFTTSVSAKILDTALLVLSDKNADLTKYATFVQNQIALLRANGQSLNAEQWANMAKALAERAIDENITPERVAAVIQPALQGVKGYGFMLKALSPETATEQLFSHFNLNANETVKKLVARVLAAIQQNL